MVLAHTRQAGAASAPIPSCPVHTGRCGHVPWGLFLLQPLQPGCHGSEGYSSGLSVRAVRHRLRKEKKKKSSSLHPLYRAWGSCHFLQKRNQDKAFTTYPGPNPRQFNGLLSPGAEEQYFALGSNVSPTLPSECKYLKTKPCPCLTDALDGQVVCALLAWARFGESSQFILSPVGWLWVRPLVTNGAQSLSLRLLIQAASLR